MSVVDLGPTGCVELEAVEGVDAAIHRIVRRPADRRSGTVGPWSSRVLCVRGAVIMPYVLGVRVGLRHGGHLRGELLQLMHAPSFPPWRLVEVVGAVVSLYNAPSEQRDLTHHPHTSSVGSPARLGSCWRWRPAGDYVHHSVLEKPTTTSARQWDTEFGTMFLREPQLPKNNRKKTTARL